jgi:Phage integrase family
VSGFLTITRTVQYRKVAGQVLAGAPKSGKGRKVDVPLKRWYRLLSVAGLRSLKLHALRHTYASLLLQDGESPTYVKEQMGHSSIQVTVDVYGHFIPGKNRGAVERLAGATSRPVPRPDFDATMTVAADVQGCPASIRESGAPGVTRTPGTQFRKLLLYPPELRGRRDRRVAGLKSSIPRGPR